MISRPRLEAAGCRTLSDEPEDTLVVGGQTWPFFAWAASIWVADDTGHEWLFPTGKIVDLFTPEDCDGLIGQTVLETLLLIQNKKTLILAW